MERRRKKKLLRIEKKDFILLNGTSGMTMVKRRVKEIRRLET